MKARFRCIDVVAPARDFSARRFPIVLGRDPTADVRLQDTWVSRFHCEITEQNGGLRVRDLGSTNGTLVNGEHVYGDRELHSGDRLTVGLTTFEVTTTRRWPIWGSSRDVPSDHAGEPASVS